MRDKLKIDTYYNFPLRILESTEFSNTLICSHYRNTTLGIQNNSFRCYSTDMFKEKWICEIDIDPKMIAIHEGLLYGDLWHIVTDKGSICCVNPHDGSLLWNNKLNAYSRHGFLFADKLVCIATDRYCYLFDLITGKKVRRIEYEYFESPLMWWPESNEILNIDMEGNLIALSPEDGKVSRIFKFYKNKILKAELDSTERSFRNPTVFTRYKEHLLIGWPSHKLLAFDLISWSIMNVYNVTPFSKVLINDNETAFMQTKHDNFDGYKFGAINLKSGGSLWEVDVPFSKGDAAWSPEPYVLNDQLIWICTADGPFYALSQKTGEMCFLFDLPAASKYFPNLEKESQPIGHFFKFKSKFYVQLRDQLCSLHF